MELLILLVQRRGELVSRDDIAGCLWGKDVFLDVDHSINTAIRKIRVALRDDPEKPRFLETVVGKGYRFAATVTCNNGDSNPQVQPPPPPTQVLSEPAVLYTQKRFLSIRLWVLLVGVAVVAVGAALWLKRTEYFWRDPIAAARFQTVTEFEGVEQAAAVSRDGQFVAFLSDRDGQMDVWVTQVGSGRFHNLTHGSQSELVNPSVRTLGFSPDGSQVTFWVRKKDASNEGDISIGPFRRSGDSRCRTLKVRQSSTGRTMARNSRTTHQGPEIHCSCRTATARPRRVPSSPQRPESTRTFRCGLPTIGLSTSSWVLSQTNWISGASLRLAEPPNGSRPTRGA
jgi:DNA-binding winged helix-turn-helix (wHTH) protein